MNLLENGPMIHEAAEELLDLLADRLTLRRGWQQEKARADDLHAKLSESYVRESEMAKALQSINDLMFARGAPLGSETYFDVRRLAVDALLSCGRASGLARVTSSEEDVA